MSDDGERLRTPLPTPQPDRSRPLGEFPRPKPTLLAEAIADSMAEAIATGHLLPGERIVETALAQKYGVSRVPVREALKVLATQGILVGGGHRGYRVVSFAPERIEQVFEVRLALETILLRDAVTNWSRRGGGLSDLDSVIETMRAAVRAGDLRGMLRADLEFHRAICHASGNEITGALWNAIARHVLVIFNLARHRDVDLERSLNQHLALRDWIRARVDALGEGGSVLGTEAGDFRSALERHFQPRRSARPPSGRGTERGTCPARGVDSAGAGPQRPDSARHC